MEVDVGQSFCCVPKGFVVDPPEWFVGGGEGGEGEEMVREEVVEEVFGAVAAKGGEGGWKGGKRGRGEELTKELEEEGGGELGAGEGDLEERTR